jgi:hypothetical protein
MSYRTPNKILYQQACTVFQLLARRTWGDLEDGFHSGLSISEESITDFLLLDLKKALPNNIFVRKFSKLQEGKSTGADWEWWFVGGGRGFGMRVQAKRLSTATQKYEDLGRLAGKSGKLQVDLLIKDAQKANLYPAYCFYNFWDSAKPLPAWNCRSFVANWRMFGCALADAGAIKLLISKGLNDLQSVAEHCLPWSCLVCCQGFAPKPQATLADRIRILISEFLGATEQLGGRNENLLPEVIEAERWPSYVRAILEAPVTEIIERPEGRNIDGVLVLRIE